MKIFRKHFDTITELPISNFIRPPFSYLFDFHIEPGAARLFTMGKSAVFSSGNQATQIVCGSSFFNQVQRAYRVAHAYENPPLKHLSEIISLDLVRRQRSHYRPNDMPFRRTKDPVVGVQFYSPHHHGMTVKISAGSWLASGNKELFKQEMADARTLSEGSPASLDPNVLAEYNQLDKFSGLSSQLEMDKKFVLTRHSQDYEEKTGHILPLLEARKGTAKEVDFYQVIVKGTSKSVQFGASAVEIANGSSMYEVIIATSGSGNDANTRTMASKESNIITYYPKAEKTIVYPNQLTIARGASKRVIATRGSCTFCDTQAPTLMNQWFLNNPEFRVLDKDLRALDATNSAQALILDRSSAGPKLSRGSAFVFYDQSYPPTDHVDGGVVLSNSLISGKGKNWVKYLKYTGTKKLNPAVYFASFMRSVVQAIPGIGPSNYYMYTDQKERSISADQEFVKTVYSDRWFSHGHIYSTRLPHVSGYFNIVEDMKTHFIMSRGIKVTTESRYTQSYLRQTEVVQSSYLDAKRIMISSGQSAPARALAYVGIWPQGAYNLNNVSGYAFIKTVKKTINLYRNTRTTLTAELKVLDAMIKSETMACLPSPYMLPPASAMISKTCLAGFKIYKPNCIITLDPYLTIPYISVAMRLLSPVTQMHRAAGERSVYVYHIYDVVSMWVVVIKNDKQYKVVVLTRGHAAIPTTLIETNRSFR